VRGRKIVFYLGAVVFAVGVALFALELLSIRAPDGLLPLFIGCALMLASRFLQDGPVRGVDH
jgi:hypothetical protein